MTKPKKKKSVEKTKSSETLPPVENVTEARQPRVRVNREDFMKRLTEKLTHFDASLVLEAAMLSVGVEASEGYFKKEETKEICLALIKRGGPAFSVGTGIYREVIGG